MDLNRISLMVGCAALLLLACGDKNDGGAKSVKGDPALTAEVVDVAERFCACPDQACASSVKGTTGRTPRELFLTLSTSQLTPAELALWEEARGRWSHCGQPGYDRFGGVAPPAAPGIDAGASPP